MQILFLPTRFIFPSLHNTLLKRQTSKKLSDSKHNKILLLLTFVAGMKFKFANLLIVKYSMGPRSNTNTKSDKSLKMSKH